MLQSLFNAMIFVLGQIGHFTGNDDLIHLQKAICTIADVLNIYVNAAVG